MAPRWRPSTILDLWCAWLDHPQRAFDGLYHCAKFGWDGYSSFDNMQVLIFCELGLKTPVYGPKIGVLGIFDPLNGEAYQQNSQKAHPWAERRHMTYRSSKSGHRCDLCAWLRDQKKKDKDSGKLGIRQDHPRRWNDMKFCMVGGFPEGVVLRFEFHQNRLSGKRFRSCAGG